MDAGEGPGGGRQGDPGLSQHQGLDRSRRWIGAKRDQATGAGARFADWSAGNTRQPVLIKERIRAMMVRGKGSRRWRESNDGQATLRRSSPAMRVQPVPMGEHHCWAKVSRGDYGEAATVGVRQRRP